MELFAKRMTWELDNDDGLSCLFFELEDGYFTLSRKTGTEALRLEMNDPANGQLIDPDCFEYALDNTQVSSKYRAEQPKGSAVSGRTPHQYGVVWRNRPSLHSSQQATA